MTPIPRKQRESGIFKEVWRAHNSLLDFVREIAPMPSTSHGVSIDRKSNGTSFKVSPSAKSTPGGQVVRFRVISVQNDYLVCTNLETNEQTNVAKPFNLRFTGWSGASVSYALEPYPSAPASPMVVSYLHITPEYRQASVGTYTEHQVIRPQYVPEFSEIFAAACEDTGVSGCDWVDVNDGGRAWTMVTS